MEEKNLLDKDDFYIPAEDLQAELKVKGSRFICTVSHCTTKEGVEKAYSDLKKKYYDATHNCFAWRIDKEIWRYSDDGEPGGTAGIPILQAIDRFALMEILCVVTRYFGGIKLGTGGLARAYEASAMEALKKLKIKVKTHFAEIIIQFEYAMEPVVRKILNQFRGKLIKAEYSRSVLLRTKVPKSSADAFKETLQELSNSTIKIIQ
jgi:uncharacterized YigZ family protein